MSHELKWHAHDHDMDRERPRVNFWLRQIMVTSLTCMLTIVTLDRERSRILWKLTSWNSRAGMACSRSWHRIVSAPDFLKKWSPEDTWWSRARGACSRSWREIVSTPDLSDEECSLVTGSGCLLTVVTSDREHPRVFTKNEHSSSRAGGPCSRSWLLGFPD